MPHTLRGHRHLIPKPQTISHTISGISNVAGEMIRDRKDDKVRHLIPRIIMQYMYSNKRALCHAKFSKLFPKCLRMQHATRETNSRSIQITKKMRQNILIINKETLFIIATRSVWMTTTNHKTPIGTWENKLVKRQQAEDSLVVRYSFSIFLYVKSSSPVFHPVCFL